MTPLAQQLQFLRYSNTRLSVAAYGTPPKLLSTLRNSPISREALRPAWCDIYVDMNSLDQLESYIMESCGSLSQGDLTIKMAEQAHRFLDPGPRNNLGVGVVVHNFSKYISDTIQVDLAMTLSYGEFEPVTHDVIVLLKPSPRDKLEDEIVKIVVAEIARFMGYKEAAPQPASTLSRLKAYLRDSVSLSEYFGFP